MEFKISHNDNITLCISFVGYELSRFCYCSQKTTVRQCKDWF